jgi:putative ABC transport system permease protein
MVGLTLVTGIAILSASLRATVGVIIEESFRADFAIQQPGGGFGPPVGISPVVADELEQLPETGAVSRIRANVARIDDRITFVGAVEPNITSLFDFDVLSGTFDNLVGDDTVAVYVGRAEEDGLAVGDTVAIEFARSGLAEFRVVALWDTAAVQAEHFLSIDAYRANFVEDLDTVVYVGLADGVDNAAGRRAVESVTDRYATAEVFNGAEFRQDAEEQLNQLLALVFGLLALAIVISLFGITNTLALSIIERTREIGIIRAVGMTRSQVRSVVRWEAAIIAVFGALLGVILGVALGWVIVKALQDQGIIFTVPVGQVVALVAAAGLAGVVAAVYPARRAARLDVIAAISYE